MYSRGFTGPDDMKEKKILQIETLKVFNDNVSEIRSGEEYRVDFTLSCSGNSQNFSLHVILPTNFPLERPQLKVKPPLTHSWVDSVTGQITEAPGLLNYSIHSDLGRVVQAIISDFRRHCSEGMVQQQNEEAETRVADVPTTGGGGMIDLLQRMHTDKLQQLCDSDDACDDLLEQLPPMVSLEAEIQRLDSLNNEISTDMLAQEAGLLDLKKRVKEKAKIVAELHARYEDRSSQYIQLSNLLTPVSIKASLHEAAAESDNKSEHVAEEFLNGNVDVENFIEKFIAERMVGQKRRIKEEKLHRQLQDLERAGY